MLLLIIKIWRELSFFMAIVIFITGDQHHIAECHAVHQEATDRHRIRYFLDFQIKHFLHDPHTSKGFLYQNVVLFFELL